MKAFIVDLETSIKCPVGNSKANPMWPANQICYMGIKRLASGYSYRKGGPVKPIPPDVLLIGHNIKFDLLYMFRDMPNPVLPYIWDTQLAAYLISGQRHKYPALNDLIKERGGEVKDDRLKEFWDNGVNTEDIPESIILPYLQNDVEETEKEFNLQWKWCEENNCLPFFLSQMDALRATIAMNLAGMAIDWEYVQGQQAHYNKHVDYLRSMLPYKLSEEEAWASPKQLSTYFFGGEEKYVEKEFVGYYKNGKPKYKNVEKVRSIPAKTEPIGEKGKGGYYSVDDAALEILAKKFPEAEIISDMRLSSKVATTYYQGIINARMPSNRIYPQLNHTSTSTGRLSCTAPNLQNQTDAGNVKRAYISRHGEDGEHGFILELDYSQLEMVWLAYIANDAQLIEDISLGRDMHEELFKDMYGRKPDKAERKAFKPRTFSLVYGAGATGIATQGKISLAEAKKFIKTFYSRYKGVAAFHENIVESANKQKEVFYEEDKAGARYRYTHVMPWGRRYVFQTYHNDRTGEQTFSPTELKNYLVQGSATGDMVPMMVGKLQRAIEETEHYKKGKVCLVMTVHDSVILDVHKDVLYDVGKLALNVMEDAPNAVKEFGIDFPCQLSCGVEAGSNWQDKQDIK